jgi:hypothetical protein
MRDVFVSHVHQDQQAAVTIAAGLEHCGRSVWYYERDSVPGANYLRQTREAIDNAQCVLLLISPSALDNYKQMDRELVRAHESGKPIIPLLVDVAFADFVAARPEWHQALGAVIMAETTTATVKDVVPRIIAGLEWHPIGTVGTETGERQKPEESYSCRPGSTIDLNSDEGFENVLSVEPVEEDACEETSGQNSEYLPATIVHEHPSTGFLADVLVPPDYPQANAQLQVAFNHSLLAVSPWRLDLKLPASESPIQYVRLANAIHGFPIVLRVLWLSRTSPWSSLRRSAGIAKAPPVKILATENALSCQNEVGIITNGHFDVILPIGKTVPAIERRRFHTVRNSQKAIALTPAVRDSNGLVTDFQKMRITLPPAAAGVAWIEFQFRIDPDGRLTLFAKDPLIRLAVRDVMIVQ